MPEDERAEDDVPEVGAAGDGDSAPAEPTTRTRRVSVPRPFPRRTLEQALRVPKAIKEKNGGQPWAPSEVSGALGMGTGRSSNFFYLSASARDFGLTDGINSSPEISIADLGRRIVSPSFPGENEQALREAFLRVELFRKVVEHYGGSNLPEEPFRSNTLIQTFGLDESVVPEFIDLFEKNARFVGIGNDFRQDVVAQSTSPQPSSVFVAAPAATASGGQSGELVCFVAMPFTEHTDAQPIGFFEEVLTSLLTPAIVDAGFTVRTAKRQGSDIIQSTIVNELLEADLVVADLTEHNPNVLFELGMRMNADKPVALIRAKGTGAIFDVDHMLRVEDYNPNLWPSTVAKDVAALTQHIRAAWDDRDSGATFMKLLRGTVTP
ncbi:MULTISPECIES: hypothetical protein [unclassified Curtobacterium]|uniref:hypothetical protein n=1 Tax=unclassified Curtobacterium TaxID=257496 RepID=UPI001C31321B|nr:MULTISPECIES: hypothetical protein [unclassified Curtobacterium]